VPLATWSAKRAILELGSVTFAISDESPALSYRLEQDFQRMVVAVVVVAVV